MALSEHGRLGRGSAWMRSPDLPVWWSGFRSTTYELQQAGWEFVLEDPYNYHGGFREFRFFIRDRNSGLVGHGRVGERAVRERADLSGFHDSMMRSGEPLQIEYMRAEHNVVVRHAGPFRASRVDMEPRVEYRERPLSSFELFRPWAPEAKDIILPQDSAMELLERLKKLHAPEMAKARERAKMEGQRGQETIHAQVISLAA